MLSAAALEMPVDKRDAFLKGACLGDPALHQRVEALVAAHDRPEPLPPSDAPAAKATIKLDLAEAADEAVGKTIGRYKVLEKVGEGGCGVVYVAEQSEPVRRRVALKVIKLGMDTKQVVARFEAERQALAMMDHPNIAKVLDAGATETGRPYFVMELVRGIRITEYCDQASLTTNERIELFICVCQAIQHAHQKGIIHRDIKPSNILVTLHDGVPVPKVIDFGIAKATEGRLTDATVYTELHQFIGTPAYMSPEQAEMSGLDIDTRSDIYSLGVLLYELLAGSTPFDSKDLMADGLDQMRKMIREKEPVRPSTRFATLKGEELTTTAKRRSADTSKLIHQLKGDLDWIVMKCLEKDRRRRYDTATGLATDLTRHLNNEPVVARPPSAAYKFEKAFRRNKLAFAAGLAVAAALFLGIIASTLEAIRAKRAEAMALQSRSDAEKLSNFMLDDFYAELEPSGRYDTVARLAKQALAYYDGLPPSLRSPETECNSALARARLAVVTAKQGDLKGALAMAQETLAKLNQMRQRGDQSEGTIYAYEMAMEAEIWCYFRQGDTKSVLSNLQKVFNTLRPMANSAGASRRIKLEYANLLNVPSHSLPLEEGVTACEEALRILEGLGALDLSDLNAASAWADIADSEAREAMRLGRLDEAERLEKQVQTVADGVLARRAGDLRARLDLILAPDMLSRIESRRFHENAALRLATQADLAVEDYLRFNPSDDHVWTTLATEDVNVGSLLFSLGRIAESLRETRAAIPRLGDHGDLFGLTPAGLLWQNIAIEEAQCENRSGAEQALREAGRALGVSANRNRVAEYIRDYWQERLNNAESQSKLALGDDAAAYEMANKALPRVDKLRGNSTDKTMQASALNLQRQILVVAARSLLNLGRYADAESAGRALVQLLQEHEGQTEYLSQEGYDADWGQVLLAEAILKQGRKAEALQTVQLALAHYHDAQTQGASFLAFRQHFARALYVQALAESNDNGGIARSREALDQAAALLQGFTDEARQSHDSKELLAWIAAAQKKLNPNAEAKK